MPFVMLLGDETCFLDLPNIVYCLKEQSRRDADSRSASQAISHT
jgi:hypothetical protein